MKLPKLLTRKKNSLVTAPPGAVLLEDGEKRILEKGTIVEAKGRTWILKEAVEIEPT